uniref:Uncharacterized protein n=1 Tax=Thermogemmatispora argillosa TaxID=2045280 RepID=A0A455T946_9CHLR|nr:hypothetical protein KTA_41960 [Thermogemmatispora argillosa]
MIEGVIVALLLDEEPLNEGACLSLSLAHCRSLLLSVPDNSVELYSTRSLGERSDGWLAAPGAVRPGLFFQVGFGDDSGTTLGVRAPPGNVPPLLTQAHCSG